MAYISYGYRYYILACFFVASENIMVGYYEISSNSITNIRYNVDPIYEISNIKYIKSETNYNRRKTLICFVKENNSTYCLKFYINDNIGRFYELMPISKKCRNELYGMKINYLFETNEIIFSCSGSDGSIETYIFDIELNTPDYSIKQFTSCESIYGFSIMYTSDYYILSDVKCNEKSKPYIK